MKVVNTGKSYRIYGDDLKVYDVIPPGAYIVRFSKMSGFYLDAHADLEIKEDKVYGVHDHKVDKVMNAFGQFSRNLGIILSGDKGIGKSLFSRMLCNKAVAAGYPVIIVDEFNPGINSFIEEIEQEVVVLFDEFDKTFSSGGNKDEGLSPQSSLLSMFDGVAAGKKMYIITCNKFHSLNDYLINRPGRFHYHFRFDYPTADEVKVYMQDKLSEKFWSEIPKVIDFAAKVDVNYDCLRAIVYELENGERFEDAILDLNILNINETRYDVTLHFEDGTAASRIGHKLDIFSTRPESVWLNDVNYVSPTITFVPSNAKHDRMKGCATLNMDMVSVRYSYDEDDADDKATADKLKPTHVTITQVAKTKYHYAL